MPHKPTLGVESSELGQSMSDISIKPNELDFSCDKPIEVFNNLTNAKDLRANLSQEGMLDVEQGTKSKAAYHAWI